MPKVKRGRRHHHTKYKNYERTWQNRSTPLCDITNKPANCLEQLQLAQSSLLLPQWYVLKGSDYVEVSYQTTTPSTIKFSVKVSEQLQWNVRVCGRLVPCENSLYTEHPTLVTSVETLNKLCSSVECMKICSGNDDECFVSIVKDRGGVIMKNEAMTAYLDGNCVRHSKCCILMKEVGRCLLCKQYRSTLRAISQDPKTQPLQLHLH